ncbi:CocE/NonD family hydrolase [Prochlorococcus sp. MIT 1307]|uniref:CocE/NonD family hydrolase n=1 Tax=Prochlorococcus sp. MIT 1307 TaxID=3096219 RepID=UPI002A764292|nr:CocE/NonD family hydrolase [Prochlorococcus sp. MIT 1307]
MESIAWRDEKLLLKDGVNLISRIWTPANGGGPWPALLMRQPYGREIASTVTFNHPVWWASHGYLVVVQDVRGQGGSEGTFTGFKQEASDTSQTHEWVRSLQDCNGLLGTYGFSYQGLTQLTANPNTRPPECLAPAMTGLNENDHWSCDGGAFWWHLGLAWGLQLAALKANRNGDQERWERIRNSLENKTYLKEGALLLKEIDPQGMAYDWFTRSSKNNQEWIVHQPPANWLRQPMLLIGGWWDPHLRGVIDLYQKSIEAGGAPELHIGPATHLQWWAEAQELLLSFFNQHLKSPTTKRIKAPKQRLWNITKKVWQLSNQSTNPSHYWGLSSQGAACLDPNEGVLQPNLKSFGTLNIVHDPWRPVPAIGGHLSPQAGLADRKDLDMRGDIATFTSKELKDNLRLEGIPVLKLIVKADKDGFDLCVALSVINHKETKVLQISTGILRVIGEAAKEELAREVRFQAVLADIKRGEKLRLSIAGSAWPAIGINPGQSNTPCGATGVHCNVITINLTLSGSNFHVLPLLA